MSSKTQLAIAVAIILWASAFVGIRFGLQEYSPEGLALLRYLIASIFMGIIYFRLPNRSRINFADACKLLAVGAIGIGVYNVTLNYGELTISSGMASFIVSQAPLITTVFAIMFLGEKLNFPRVFGFFISMAGVALIAVGEQSASSWDMSLLYIFVATLAGGLYTIMQKPFLKKYRAIETTTFVIWGGVLFLSIYVTQLQHDLIHVSLKSTLIVIYLGIFPAAMGYIAWSYALSEIPASRAVSFLYLSPFIATLLGWVCLGETPVLLSVVGGIFAITGVVVVNRSFRKPAVINSVVT